MSKTLWIVIGIAFIWFQSGSRLPNSESQEELIETLQVLASSGKTFYSQNKLDSAAFYLDSANRLINRYHILDTALVQETKNTYGIVLAYLQRNGESIKVFEELNAFYLQVEDDPHIKTKRAKVFNNIAINYNFLSDYEQAIRYFDSCLVIFNDRSLLQDKQTQTLYLNKALNQLDLGDYQSALENIELSRHIRGQNSVSSQDQYALMRENLIYAEVLLEINQDKEDILAAIKHLHEGIAILRAINPGDYYHGSFLGLLSKAHYLLGAYEEATDYAIQTQNFLISSYGDKYTGLIFRYNEYAKILVAQGKIDSARHYLSKALEIPVQADANKTMYKVQALLQLADIANLDSIPMFVSRATDLLFPGFSDTTDILRNPPPNLIPTHPYMGAFFTKKGALLHKLYQQNGRVDYLVQALDCYMIAIREGGRSRKGLMTLRSKATFSNLLHDSFSQAMALAHTLYEKTGADTDLEKILWISDQSKSALLKEHLVTALTTSIGVPQQVRIEELELKSKIIQLEQRVYSHSAANQLWPDREGGSVMAELLEAKLDFDRWLRKLDDKYPNYRQIMYGVSYTEQEEKRVNINENRLKGKTLIDYFDSERTFYIQYITKGKKGAIAVEKSEKLMSAIANVRIALSDPKGHETYEHAAKLMYDHLLFPVIRETSPDHIVIIPDGILAHIPFEALLDSVDHAAQTFKDYPYLVHKYRFSYHGALSLLERPQHRKIEDGELSVFAMAPTYNDQSSLAKLPNAANEVVSIQDIFPGQFLQGSNATESSLKQMTGKPTIIHLAVHSAINNQNPLQSHLILSPDSSNDGLLHTYELLSMNLDADLICLSACNSGFGELQRGEGVMSLARGFMYANVPNVLMSLWAVPDKATGDIMKSFYAELRNGRPYDQAIHQAKIAYLSNADEHLSNPFYWASFIYMGDIPNDDPIAVFWWWVIGGLVLGGAIVLYYNKRNPIKE
ncbi:CHAT domain-containing protein [Sphingobacterium olei]|uniref:CHAT domain-containing protein n=1 Tax=Sphingobacterium olei TaxID=2571155 RepID=A0A4U0NYX0_9SPHI|nr:CHAT domain-containing tetratricopeptide repeat protein [Sphingobacterium olei]TJZ59910.1 CHAT domain-containing protein [Sphingobacterium olei]